MSQRKRASGFALMDAAFAADPKFLKLYRVARTPRDYAAAVGVFWIILADARRNRSAEVDWDEYRDYKAQVAALRQVGLLTASGFDETVFVRWAPAYRSPSDQRRGTQGYANAQRVPSRTSGTLTSDQFSSYQGGRGSGEGERAPGEAPLPIHDGRHTDCAVCAPMRKPA